MIAAIPLISKLPFIGTALNFFIQKKRLVIEYLLIAILLGTAGALVTLWLQKQGLDKRLESTLERVTVLEITTQQAEEAITNLKNMRARDARALEGLINDFKSLSEDDSRVRSRLKKLEASNETVRKYLDSPVPIALQCLLDGTCEDASGDKDRSPTATAIPLKAVRGTSQGKVPADKGHR